MKHNTRLTDFVYTLPLVPRAYSTLIGYERKMIFPLQGATLFKQVPKSNIHLFLC